MQFCSFILFCFFESRFNTASGMDCMQFKDSNWKRFRQLRFNTASGMDCMQYQSRASANGSGKFQYRKRYGLHAMVTNILIALERQRFNTASGMDCMQYKDTAVVLSDMLFQYRKRYGLHAIPSLTALGTAEPRSGFSKRIALFGKSPQPRGIFLSPKSAENVRKPCNIKETFVHGKNLKLMAFSREFLPSL